MGYSGGYYLNNEDDIHNYYWFFDVDDLAAVKAGSMQPNDMRPYATGAFDTPFGPSGFSADVTVRGGTYDYDNDRLYLSIQRADDSQSGETNLPLIVAYSITVS